MRKLAVISGIALSFMLATAPTARAQDEQGTPSSGGTIGLGAETILNSSLDSNFDIGAAAFHYEAEKFHINGLLLFLNVADVSTSFGLGGRFFYELHEGDRSDFSIGGGLIIVNVDPELGDSSTDTHLEVSGKIRAWLTSNVAIHSMFGLAIMLADDNSGGFGGASNDTFGLFGMLNGSVGITYLFR